MSYRSTKRLEIIEALCAEREGTWADGTQAIEVEIQDAARHPQSYDIDTDDLDGACEGDAGAILRLRHAWKLPALQKGGVA